ncbi:hypothetical protein HK101_009274 [Irineochytrium annulatum]|nr:hypothetical protein HK101_009274 [Irineochytrium annulatum]
MSCFRKNNVWHVRQAHVFSLAPTSEDEQEEGERERWSVSSESEELRDERRASRSAADAVGRGSLDEDGTVNGIGATYVSGATGRMSGKSAEWKGAKLRSGDGDSHAMELAGVAEVVEIAGLAQTGGDGDGEGLELGLADDAGVALLRPRMSNPARSARSLSGALQAGDDAREMMSSITERAGDAAAMCDDGALRV